MTGILDSLRAALRGLRRQPGLTLVAVAMLSLGVAASAAVFTMVDVLFLRPLPFDEADRLVYVDETAPAWNLERVGIDYHDFDTWRRGVGVFDGLGLLTTASYNLSAEGGAERVEGARVTWDLAPALRIQPVAGRLFTPEDDRPGAPPVVMLGHDLWRQRYGGSPDVVGSTVRIDGQARTVVGVLPPEARFPTDVQLWTPLALDPEEAQGSYSYQGIGRLEPGVTVAMAQDDLRRAHLPIWEEHDTERVVSPIAMPLRDRLTGDFRGIAAALGVAVALVLLIACGNVASILLARSFARRRELAIRQALGAGRGRIAGQLLAESLALAVVAGPLGLVLGYWAVKLLASVAPEGLPSWMVLAPDWRMALFGLAAVLGTTLLFGWAPVLQARRHDVRGALGDGGGRAGGSRGQRRTMNALVVAEITLAALLLVGGGLLLRTFERLRDADPGFRVADVLQFRVALPDATYPDDTDRSAFYRRLVDGLEALPGVRAAGGVTCPPFGCHTGGFFAAEGGLGSGPDDPNPVVLYRSATPGYFTAMGITAVRGRLLGADDERPDGRRSVLVNETFARRFFPDTDDPVGRRIAFRGNDFAEEGFHVVGVARDVKHYGLDEEMRPAIYFPYAPHPEPSLAMAVWTAGGDPAALVPAVRNAVHRIDPDLPLFQVATNEQALRESLTLRRTSAWMMAVIAGLALVLALGGIYGVLSYVVGQGMREIGIRVALGATRRRVLRLVLRHGLALVATGLALGFAASLAAGRALGSLLVGVAPHDPATFAGVAAVVAATALLAALVPARRALRVDPGRVLRDE
jgi:predicted permease